MDSDSSPTIVYMIGNAHIDPVWLWPLSEGREEVLSTYRTAISLIEEYDGYIFTSGGAVTYRWVAEDDPALFEAIRAAVAAGRWALVNGWWLQPDCNIPHGESFARHALYGQRELMARFGRRARVGYNVDSFGHANTLPQLLKLGGLDYYVFFRPGPHEKELPGGPFWWEAPGGARVLVCRPPLHYGNPEDEDIQERIRRAAQQAPEGLGMVMCFYGVGNHGGGPTRRNVQAILSLQETAREIRPLFSAPDSFFTQVERLDKSWPVVRDDLQHHARGCYTALSRVKRENRQAEHALMRAERLSALATLLCAAPNETGALRDAWQEVLFNQFHDILAGTSIRAAYDDVWRKYASARDTADRVQRQALAALSSRVNVPTGEGRPLLVWNALPWDRSDVVSFSLPLGGWRHDFQGERYPGAPVVTDARGEAVPSQLVAVEFDHNTYVAHIEALVRVPAMGCRLLYVTLSEQSPPEHEPVPPTTDTLENDALRVRIDPDTGWMTSLWDIQHNVELLAGPSAVPLVIADPSDTWSHGIASFRDVCGAFRATRPPELVQDSAVRRTLRIHSEWGGSTLTQDVTLYRSGDFVDLDLSIDWHERHKMLKLAFPFRLDAARAVAATPYGWIERPASGEEEPCQAWIGLEGSMGGKAWGVCLLNDSKYGYDALGGELRLSLLRSPIYAFHDPRRVYPGVTYHYTDQGVQQVHCRLVPGKGGWRGAEPARRSEELHEPFIAWPVAPHAGSWGDVSLLRVSPHHALTTVVKLAEESEELIVRGYEAEGQPACLEVESEVLGQRWAYEAAPHEIYTLALPAGAGAAALNLLEEPR